MQITLSADYAVRAVLHLAAHAAGGPVPSAAIAREQGIPPDYVPKVLQALARAGIVVTQPGRHGGAHLLLSPEELSVLAVVEALDGPVALNRCILRAGECPRNEHCPVHEVWAGVQNDVVSRLGRVNFARLLRRASPKKRKGRKSRAGKRRKSVDA